jgi:hypothetical protein
MDGQKFTMGQRLALFLLYFSIFAAIVLGSARLFPRAHSIVFYILGLVVLSRYVRNGVEATVGKWLIGDKNNSQSGEEQ